MKNKTKFVYPAVFTKDGEETGYSVDFPDFENCYTCGDGLEHSIEMARERLGIEIEEYFEAKKDLPAPSDISIILNPDDGFTTFIDVDMIKFYKQMNAENIRKNCTLPKWLNDLAEDDNINFSAVLQEALKEKLGV